VIDLRSLRPLDLETVVASVRKTIRALGVEEGWPSYGVSAELAARIQKACFEDLDAPVERVGRAEVRTRTPRTWSRRRYRPRSGSRRR
jgi:pyruvate dehydrogenase E1 component beta subunit